MPNSAGGNTPQALEGQGQRAIPTQSDFPPQHRSPGRTNKVRGSKLNGLGLKLKLHVAQASADDEEATDA